MPKEIAQQAAASFFKAPASNVSIVDLTATRFGWAKKHAFFMAMNEERRRLLVSVDSSGSAYPFQPFSSVAHMDESRFSLLMLNSIVAAEGMQLPNDLDLAWTLRNVVTGLGGWVAGTAFYENEKSALHLWTHLRSKDGPTLFQKHCTEPRLERDGDRWELSFQYFNLKGGVESWRAAGDARAVLTTEAEIVLPDGTFLVPYG